MAFPSRLLQPGEEVLVDTRPRVIRLLRPLVLVVVVLGGSIAVVAMWAAAPIWFGWVLLGVIALALLVLGVRAGQWWAESLTVTSRRVVWRKGVLRRLGREIPIANVQSVSYRQSVVQRLLRTGDLLVESAGQASREPFPDVPDPAWVQSQVTAAMEHVALGRGLPAPGPFGHEQPPWGAPGEQQPDVDATRYRPGSEGSPATGAERSAGDDWEYRRWEARRAAAGQWRASRGGLYDQADRHTPHAPYVPQAAAPHAAEGAGDPQPAGGPRGAPLFDGDAPDTDPTPVVVWDGSPATGLKGAPPADVVAQIERLAALYERGVLTREEFEGKKAELLARL